VQARVRWSRGLLSRKFVSPLRDLPKKTYFVGPIQRQSLKVA
jgi:hypothetical protein